MLPPAPGAPPWKAAASGGDLLDQLPGEFIRPHVSTPSTPFVIRGPLVAAWGRGLLGFVFTAGGGGSLLPERCRVLVLLNPRGGKGKALQLFWSHVQPLLAQAGISFTLMLTGECLPEGWQGATPATVPHTYPRGHPVSPQSVGTTLGSWCRGWSWGAGTRWWSCLETG